MLVETLLSLACHCEPEGGACTPKCVWARRRGNLVFLASSFPAYRRQALLAMTNHLMGSY
jgi:hypothetical protein